MNDGIYVHTRVVGGSLEREELIFICGWQQHYDRDLDRSSRLKLESPRFLESREALLLLSYEGLLLLDLSLETLLLPLLYDGLRLGLLSRLRDLLLSRLLSLPPRPLLLPGSLISTRTLAPQIRVPSNPRAASFASRGSSISTKAKPGGFRATQTSRTLPYLLKTSSMS